MNVKDIMQTDFLTFTEDEEISKVVAALLKHKKRSAVVLSGAGEYVGVVSRRKLLNRKYAGTSKAMNVIVKTPIVLEDLDLMACAKLMHATGVQTIPVEKKGKLVGLVQILDLLKELSLDLDAAKDEVRRLKFAKPHPLKSSDTVAKALSVMIKEKVDHILVFDARQLVGILSLRDVLRVAHQNEDRISNPGKALDGRASRGAVVERNSPLQLPISSFLTTGPLLTVQRDNTLMDAVALMHKRNIRDLIVQEEEKVFGLVTVKEVLTAFVAKALEPRLQLRIRGLKKLQIHDMQEARYLALIRSEAAKLQRKAGEELRISLDLREGKTKGNARQYEIKLKVEGSNGLFTSEASAWKFDAAVRSVFKALSLSAEKKSERKSNKFLGRKRMRA